MRSIFQRAPWVDAERRRVEHADADARWEMVTDAEGRRLTGDAGEVSRAEVERWCATVAGDPSRLDLAITTHTLLQIQRQVKLRDASLDLLDPNRQAGH